MVKIKKENLLKARTDIIVHQVNVQGVMGGGVARQLSLKYPGLEKYYSNYCKKYQNDYDLLKGHVLPFTTKSDHKLIFNIFSQTPDFKTDYEIFRHCIREVRYIAQKFKLKVAMPYGIGCGIAKGDWNIISNIIIEEFRGSRVTLYMLEDKKCKKGENLKSKLKKLLNM